MNRLVEAQKEGIFEWQGAQSVQLAVFRSRLFGGAVTGVFQELHGGNGRGSVS